MCYRNLLLTCLSIFFLTILTSSENKKEDTFNSRMYFAAIIVRNIDSSMAWYTKMYDLKLKNRFDNDQRGYKQLNLVSGNMWIELVELKTGIDKSVVLKGEFANSEIHRISKFGFVSDDLDAAHAELKAKGVKFMGRNDGFFVTDQESRKRGFVIADPDGNLIQYFEK